jgi:radical SAM-linked protein
MRLRVRFSKLGKVRWTSHRDVARMWERAFRRVTLPLAYTQGFSPRPKVSFGLALPTGHESVAEYLDLELAADAPLDALGVDNLPARLSPALPAGIDVLAATVIDDRAGSLQEEVTSCSWLVEAADVTATELSELVAQALAADSLVVTRERKGRTVSDDIRPGILSIEGDGTVLRCDLATQPRGLRPSELLTALRPGLEEGSVRRVHQWIERDGARWEPIPLPATDAPHALERAS